MITWAQLGIHEKPVKEYLNNSKENENDIRNEVFKEIVVDVWV